ncbi:MAG: hypothetical protein CVU65_07980 [Deltaproteobacteria bacterium HGW-Deltaproteobacteria-22]|jgi:cysteine-rich repeat protein|nr:MAG: hypothetical protein CVU65_07980 [Deltaproteobacteria bacterium HGW-Deltaproteobacteria-22]
MTNRTTLLTLLATCLTLWSCDDNPKPKEGCGNGLLDLGEQCDGAALQGATCASLGYYNTVGILACRADCTYDVSDCGARCGDSTVDVGDGEQCDGQNLFGNSCQSLGYGSGVLACGDDCTYDTSGCTGTCGNGIMETGESCDDGNASNMDGCSSSCDVEVGWECDLDSPSLCTTTCGDSIRAGDEACDGNDLGGESCESLGYPGGTLGCSIECTFNESQCTMDRLSPNIGMLKNVPAGTFQRDATATNLSTVSAFRMSQYEITRAQWTAVTGWADPSNTGYSSGTEDPVQQVSWYDAIAFCNKLSLLEGLTPVYAVSGVDFSTLTYAQIPAADDAAWNAATANWAADGYRLPTEMEWMWAAMGADLAAPGVTNTTGHAKSFAGSTGTNAIGDYAVFGYETSEFGRTTTQRTNPVGSKLANELGLYDISGNVWEWAWDWYGGPLPAGTVTDYRGPSTGTVRVVRGGNWNASSSNCTVAYRPTLIPQYRNYVFGFRVVRP